uniref:dolichol kinase n=1 Tax=Heliothis virescens TaxID=7102 RepID=A0A2A4J010_HELVI
MDRTRKKTSLYQEIYKTLDAKLFRIVRSIDKQVTKNLKDGKIETRPSNTNGLWCCVLLPTVLLLYSTLYEVSELYKFLAYLSVGLVAYCFLFIVFLSVTCLVLKENIYGGCAASTLTATLMLYAIQNQGLAFSLIFSASAVFAFNSLLRLALLWYPKTFTVGEAMVVVQSIVLFAVMAVCEILYDMGDKQDEELKFVYSVIFAILSTVAIIVAALYVLHESQRTLSVLAYILSVAGTYTLMILHAQVGVDCIVRLTEYVILDTDRVKLFILWVCSAVLSAFAILVRTQLNVKASTVTRKTFHILASIVFLSGILFDIKLMTLAAGVGFGLLILVEALRKSKIEPISSALQAAFNVYSDEKDVGCFAMTPIYLYIGLACPLVLVPVHPGYELELLSGVLSIGVGDTAASWFGSKFGFNKWAEGHKTLEGTAFNILTQIALMYALQLFRLLNIRNAFIRVSVTAAVSGLVEAKTEQVDNLILPLVTLIAFQLTSVMCYT